MANTSPTSPYNTHHVLLTDEAGNTIAARLKRMTRGGFLEDDSTNLQRNGIVNQAVRFAQKGGEYADQMPPWASFQQKDWSGGRGIKFFHEDQTRFADSYRAWTWKGGQITPGPQETFITGAPSFIHKQNMPGDMTWQGLYGAQRYLAVQITLTSTCDRFYAWVRKQGTPPAALFGIIYTDSGGEPDAASILTTPSSFGQSDLVMAADELSELWPFKLASNLTAGTYHIVFYTNTASGDADNCWEIGCDAAVAGYKSTGDGTVWTATTFSPYYLLVLQAAHHKMYFFEYKRAMYAMYWSGSNGVLFRNGYRGAANSNSGDLTKLNDSTQGAWTSALAGGIALIIEGPGSDEQQPWRYITTGAAGVLTVSPAWITPHTPETSYVILGLNTFASISSLSSARYLPIVTDEVVYFPKGNELPMLAYVEYNKRGAWSTTNITTTMYAHNMVGRRDPNSGRQILHGILNGTPGESSNPVQRPSYFRVNAGLTSANPQPYRDLGQLAPTDVPWNQHTFANITQGLGVFGTQATIASGFTTGTFSVQDLETPLDISQGVMIGVEVFSSVAVGTGQLTLTLNNQTFADQQPKLIDYCWYAEPDPLEACSKVATAATGTTPTVTDLPAAYDGRSDTNAVIALTTTLQLILVAPKKFNTIKVDLAAFNAAAGLTLTGSYFNGEVFTAHTITDGTATGGTTLAQDGNITLTLPGDWEEYTLTDSAGQSMTGYAFRLEVSGSLTGTTAVAGLAVQNTEAFNFLDLPTLRDGRDDTIQRVNIKQNGFLVFGHNTRFEEVDIDLATPVNSSGADIGATYYFNGLELATTTLGDTTTSGGSTFAQDGALTITPPDAWLKQTIEGVACYAIWCKMNANFTEEVGIYEVSVLPAQSDYILNLGTLSANEWKWTTVTLTPETGVNEKTLIKSVKLSLTADLGAQLVELRGGVRLLGKPEYHPLPGKATNIVLYGTETEEPHLFFENIKPHRLDLLNNALVPIRVTGFEAVASETNGQAAAALGVYLYFNLHNRLERYFDGSVEGVGPDRDEGLPASRSGVIRKILPAPGDDMYLVVDASASATSQYSTTYSSVLRRSGGWHEVYRAPQGDKIHDIYFQVIPGEQPNRLWIGVGKMLLYLPIPAYTNDPTKDSNMQYFHGAAVDFGALTDGMLDVPKVFKSMELFTRGLSTGQPQVRGFYKVDQETTWTEMGEIYDTSPSQEIDFGTGWYESGKQLKARVLLETDDADNGAVLEGAVIDAVTVYPPGYDYDLQFVIEDHPANLQGRVEDGTLRAETQFATLDTWRAGTVLTLNDEINHFNDRKVLIQALNSRVVEVRLEAEGPGYEQHLIGLRLLDIS